MCIPTLCRCESREAQLSGGDRRFYRRRRILITSIDQFPVAIEGTYAVLLASTRISQAW